MEDRYIRVATTLYKIVRKPLLSGDFIEMRVVWNYETFRRDHSADIKPLIEKYDGFCCVPSHTNYQRTIGTFLNDYEPVEIEPQQGQFLKVEAFLRHIFGEQYEMGLDYLQLLYTQPLQRLPIILLVSKEKNTGKTTFLNLLKAIFGANMTFNTNEDSAVSSILIGRQNWWLLLMKCFSIEKRTRSELKTYQPHAVINPKPKAKTVTR